MTVARLILAVALLLIAGCTTTAPLPPAPVVQEVNIPVVVPCKIDVPSPLRYSVDSLPIGADIWTQMKALRAERQERITYEIQLEAAAKACADTAVQPSKGTP
jgi:hypothetical protein